MSSLNARIEIADQVGDNVAARGFYEAALRIRRNELAVLAKLGLSHTLAKNLPRAEETLRIAGSQAAANMRARPNLAFVLAPRASPRSCCAATCRLETRRRTSPPFGR